jgi:hypothetical protein
LSVTIATCAWVKSIDALVPSWNQQAIHGLASGITLQNAPRGRRRAPLAIHLVFTKGEYSIDPEKLHHATQLRTSLIN